MALGPDGRLAREGIELHMNDYCRRAVAKGCELAKATGGTLTVITLGPPSADNVLREAIACGADAGVHITDPAFAGSDTWATARALASALRKLGDFDLVLLGRNSVDADTGQVPPQLATLLELPFATGVRELQLDGETLRLRLEHDDEWVEAEVELPAMLSCAERLCDPCKLKDPAVWAAVDGAKISRLTAADLGAGPWGQAGSPTSVGDVRTIAVCVVQQVIEAPVSEQVAAIMAVLEDRAALVTTLGEDGSAEPVPPRAQSSGTVDAPLVVVAVEPARTQVTRELLGAAAHLASEIGGRVVAFGPAPGDPRRLAAWGADEVHSLHGADAEEDIARSLVELCGENAPWAVLGPGTAWGRDVLSRAAAMLGAGLTGDAVELESRDVGSWRGSRVRREAGGRDPLLVADQMARCAAFFPCAPRCRGPGRRQRVVQARSRVRILGANDDDSVVANAESSSGGRRRVARRLPAAAFAGRTDGRRALRRAR
jgi:electron transfer flavoprotein alpha/beta subunit